MCRLHFILIKSFFLIVLWLTSASPLFAGETEGQDDFLLSPEEEFLFADEEVVISAAKYEQKISEAPSTIYVITEEDIRQSGLTTIPDILRMVPGLDVITVSPSQTEVNARGFNKPPSNKMVVMIDGFSYYENGYNLVLWNAFPIVLDEIKQIEIIIGPGSALYGANAFSGLINIITKTPAEIKKLQLVSTGGLINTGHDFTRHHSLLHSGNRKKLSWKLSSGWEETSRWLETDKSAETVKFGGDLRYKLAEDVIIKLSGNYITGNNEMFIQEGSFFFNSDVDRYIAGASFLWHQLEIMATYFDSNQTSEMLDAAMEISIPGVPIDLNSLDNLYFMDKLAAPYHHKILDVQGQYIFDPTKWAKINVGGTFRYNHTDWKALTSSPVVNEYSAFLQGVFDPVDYLSVTLGGRFDNYKLTGDDWSYRGSLVYSFLKNHHFRLSFGKAFRNPALLENFIELDIFPEDLGMKMKIMGNPDLEPESIYTTEIAYQGIFYNNRLKVRLTGFYSELKDLIEMGPAAYSYTPLMPGVLLPEILQFMNIEDARALGGELSFNLHWTKHIESFLNYSHEYLKYTSGTKDGQRIKTTPAHKVNGGTRIQLDNGLSVNITGHFVSPTRHKNHTAMDIFDPFNLNRGDFLDSYFLLNARIAYRFYEEKAEAAIIGNNLLGGSHKEYPLGSDIGTRLLFSLRIEF